MIRPQTEYDGYYFNKYHKDNKFYKFLDDDLTHYNSVLKPGLNIDTENYNPVNSCFDEGISFCDSSNCHHYFYEDGMTKLALIAIPDDARIYIKNDMWFVTDRLFIKEIIDFTDVDDSFWINIIPKDGEALEYVKNQTPEICELAIQQCGWALKYVKPNLLTYKLCKIAVKQNGWALKHIEQPSDVLSRAQIEKLCKLAVKQNGYALEYVKEQTNELCILAVQQNGHALGYVKKQFKTDEMCKLCRHSLKNNLVLGS